MAGKTRLSDDGGVADTPGVQSDVEADARVAVYEESRIQPVIDIVKPVVLRYARMTLDTIDWADNMLPRIRGRAALREIIANLKPGITVALVSLPLSISLAIAADATPVQGIITAAWAGLTSAFFGGSHYNIVGPTGALSGILSEFSVRYGPGIQPLLAIFAGLICLAVWALRLERFFAFIPGAVMHGFTLGVAFIIALNQLNFALGLSGLPRHERFLSNLFESINNVDSANWFALVFFCVAFGLLYNLQKKFGKIPWSIVLAMVGILIGMAQEGLGWTIRMNTISSQYKNLRLTLVQVSDVFTNGLGNLTADVWVNLGQGALSIAVVAVLETLISAHIADRMTKTLFNDRKEVLAVGLANIASGVTGGIPATAALARTALNIKSGGTSRAAGIVNGFAIILLSTVLFDLFKYLPLPVVAAILVNVALRMVEWHEVKLLFKMDKRGFAVAVLSGIICVVEDPTAGIIYGAFFAMVNLLTQLRHAHATLRIYLGYKCELHYLFDDVSNIKRSVKNARARYLGEPTTDDLDTESAPTHPHGVVNMRGKLRERSQSAAALDLDLPGHHNDHTLPRIAMYSLPGYYVYPSVQAHRDRLRLLFMDVTTQLPDIDAVVFNLKETYYADSDALETIGLLIDEMIRAGKVVYMLGFHTRVESMLKKTEWFEHVDAFTDFAALIHFLRQKPAADADAAAGDNAVVATLASPAPSSSAAASRTAAPAVDDWGTHTASAAAPRGAAAVVSADEWTTTAGSVPSQRHPF